MLLCSYSGIPEIKNSSMPASGHLIEDIFLRLPPSHFIITILWLASYDAWHVNTQGPTQNNSLHTSNDFQVRHLSPQLEM